MKKYSFILLSGGIGKRMQLNIPKQFLLLAGKPIFIHVLEKIDSIDEIAEVIIPCPKEFVEKTESIIKNYNFSKRIHCIEGGDSRQESVYKGLQEATLDHVIIHEAVRPFVSVDEYETLIHCENENAIFGTDIPFTVLQGKKVVEANLNRSNLVNVQLPHKYDRKKLLYAHECARKDAMEFTEDASLYFHYYKSEITILKGSDYNIKITKPVDRQIAEVIYKEKERY
ncbi:IspD/TarI family cytidylyltransferase [Virgibacillus sp. W0430]|uniref:IspD/TarI family cytidylyltransferase n=1 Tax=Virgibacillus sp. W0430 TaxID=3391580 RepID=UPI003F47FDF9